MNWKNRLTNYNFWISIFSAVLLILQALKIEFDIAYVNEIFTAVLGLLVVIGIISDPTRTTIKTVEKEMKANVVENKATENQVNKEIENNMPIVEKNETDAIDIQNDFQTILNKISLDLDEQRFELNEKIKELEKSFSNINKTFEISNPISNVAESMVQETSNINDTAPTAVEIGNPYIDVIN